jgi:hypothetical protein
MTRDAYDKATVALDMFNKLTGIRDKIKREIPELEYDKQLKEASKPMFEALELKIKEQADKFGNL